MTMREIPRPEWRSFLERFSREHRAWLGTMHWVSGNATVTSAQGVALESIRVDSDLSGEIVGLCFLHGPAVRLERSYALRIEQTYRGAERALEIETATGGLLRLAFRATALPEELDGMAPGEDSTSWSPRTLHRSHHPPPEEPTQSRFPANQRVTQ